MVNFNTTRALSTLVNPDKILPVAVIETVGTVGRTYQGYKRGGKVEGRERFREETTGAIFWLFGVKILNKVGDFLGKKAGIKNLDVDLGKDELRAPFLNNVKDGAAKTAIFKFGKVAASAAIATFFMGFVLPKLNHKLTEMSQNREKQNNSEQNINTLKNETLQKVSDNASYTAPSLGFSLIAPSMDKFVDGAKKQDISFKGSGHVVDLLSTAAYNLENKTAWRLMSTDVGMIAGRVANSRNKIEGFEFLFRDTSAIYFYLLATPHVVSLLNKMTGNTPIHPDSLEVYKNHLLNAMGNNKFSIEEFRKNTKDIPKEISDVLTKIPFKKDVTTLKEFNTATSNMYEAKALKMSELQPKMLEESILSKQQVVDILSNGWNTEPEFIKKALDAGTYGAASNSKKFVSRKVFEGIRDSIDDFSNNLIKYASDKGIKEIDAGVVQNFAKRTTNFNFAFRLLGMAVSGFGIAYLIPKIQYKLTELRTGSKEFPGTANYSKDAENKNTGKNIK